MSLCLLRASGLCSIFSFCTTGGTKGVAEGWIEGRKRIGWSNFGYPKENQRTKVVNDTTGRRGDRKREKKIETSEYHAIEYHANEYDTNQTKKMRERESQGQERKRETEGERKRTTVMGMSMDGMYTLCNYYSPSDTFLV